MFIDKGLNKILGVLINDIKNKRVYMLFGTGISVGSGNLVANDIKRSILFSLKYDGNKLFEDDIVNVLMKRTKQFEDFLNRIHDDNTLPQDKKLSTFQKLFKILYKGEGPNFNHCIIAQLIKGEYIKRVYTTNFDCHIEEAYKSFTSEILETCILGDSKEFNESAHYIKLHGCISNPKEMGTLLTNVASEENLKRIKPYIEELLIGNEDETALFMGYSFSDVYDIVKIIEEISESRKNEHLKNIFIIAHTEDNYEIYSNCMSFTYKIQTFFTHRVKNIEEYNDSLKDSTPTRKINFNNFDVTILKYNTSEFIRSLGYKFSLNCENKHFETINSKKEIVEWVNNLDDYYKLLISWRFNYEAGQEYLLHTNPDKIKNIMFKALNKALEICDIILNFLDKLKRESSTELKEDTINYLIILNKKHKALTLLSMGKFSKAKSLLINLQLECEVILDERLIWLKLDINASILYLEYYKILTNNYSKNELKEFIKSNEKYYLSLNAEDSTWKNNVVNYKNQYLIGTLKNYANLSEEDDKTYFKRSINFYEKKGRVEYLAFVYMEYAKFLKDKNYKQSYEFNKKAEKLFENLGYVEYSKFCKID